MVFGKILLQSADHNVNCKSLKTHLLCTDFMLKSHAHSLGKMLWW